MKQKDNISPDDKKILDSISPSRAVLPVLIGLAVVGYLIYTQVDIEELKEINFNAVFFLWIGIAILIYVIRHLFYAWRLRILSHNAFSWKKAIELIVLWEFSSAASPAAVGGSAVAVFFLSQENIKASKAISIVIYSIVADTAYNVLSLFLFYAVFGAIVVRPFLDGYIVSDGYVYTFFGILLFMTVYGFIFYYGLFVNSRPIKRFILWVSRLPFLKKFSRTLRYTANDIAVSAAELSKESSSYHLRVFFTTLGAWVCKFLVVNCIIIAVFPEISRAFYDQLLIFMRTSSMHVITSFSPTPGGSGIIEIVFSGFYADYFNKNIGFLVAVIWRLLTYYPYILLGIIIIPKWILEVMKHRKESRAKGF